MLKRLLSLIMAMFLCLVPIVGGAEEIADGDLGLLIRLNILEPIPAEGLYVRRILYTRAQLAKSFSMMLMDTEPTQESEIPAADVAGNKYLAYIQYALSNGLMELEEGNKFNPYDYVSYNDVIRGLVAVLEYDVAAEKSGGTDSDYMYWAQKIGLLRGVEPKDTENITIYELAEYIMNAMNIRPMLQPFEVVSPYKPTIMEQKELREGSGRILANARVGLMTEACNTNYVNISGVIFPTMVLIDDILVGAEVKYFLRNIDGEDTVVGIYANSSNGILSLKADEIETVDFQSDCIEITDKTDEKWQLDYTAFTLVNGANYSLIKPLFDVFESGALRAIDSDGDGLYDVVHMDIFKTYIVEAAGSDSNSILTKYTYESIPLASAGENVEIYRDNIAIDLNAVVSGNAVNVACDKLSVVNGELVFDYNNAERFLIYVSNKKINGQISSITQDEVITLGNTEYKLNSHMKALITENKIVQPTPGKPVSLLIEHFGTVIDYEIDTSTDSMQYGYLIDAAVDSAGLRKTMILKVLKEDGKITVFEMEEKYTLDGFSGVEANTLTPNASVDFSKRQLIRYRVIDGHIREIDSCTTSAKESTRSSLSLDYSSGEKKAYRFKTFEYKCAVAKETVIFRVPSLSQTSVTDKQFMCPAANFFQQDLTYLAEGYDLDAMLNAGCIVIYEENSQTSLTYQDNCFMIGNVTQAVDEEGSPAWCVELWGRTKSQGTSETRKLFLTSDVDLRRNHKFEFGHNAVAQISNYLQISDFKKGDIVRYLQDNSGYIIYMERVFTPSTTEALTPFTLGSSGYGAYMRSYMAKKESALENFICVCSAEDMSQAQKSEYATFLVNFFKSVCIYNVKTGKIKQIEDMDALPTYLKASDTKLFIHISYSDVVNVFAYQWD